MPSRCPDTEHGNSPGRWESADCSNWHASIRVLVMGEQGRLGWGYCWLLRMGEGGREEEGKRPTFLWQVDGQRQQEVLQPLVEGEKAKRDALRERREELGPALRKN